MTDASTPAIWRRLTKYRMFNGLEGNPELTTEGVDHPYAGPIVVRVDELDTALRACADELETAQLADVQAEATHLDYTELVALREENRRLRACADALAPSPADNGEEMRNDTRVDGERLSDGQDLPRTSQRDR